MKTRMKIPVSILSAVAVLALAGCHRHHHAPAKHAAAASTGIVVSQARLVLPAVKGNPAAAYFSLANEGKVAVTLVGVDVVGAQKAEMHETSGGTMQPLAQVGVDPGQRAIFAPGGKHVMVFSLAPNLTAGGSSEIVLHFQGGKTTSAPMGIEPPGDGAGDMAGMNMGGKP